MPSLHCASVSLYRGKVMIKKDTLLDTRLNLTLYLCTRFSHLLFTSLVSKLPSPLSFKKTLMKTYAALTSRLNHIPDTVMTTSDHIDHCKVSN